MRKISFIFIFLTFLLSVSLVKADGINIFVKSKELIGYTGDTVTIEITVQNTQSVTDDISINVWPSYWVGISANLEKSRVKITSGSNETIKLDFSIPRDLDEMGVLYNVTTTSINNPNISGLQILNLRVKRSVPIYISEVNAEKYIVKPGESVKIEILVSNSGPADYTDASLNTKIKKDNAIFKEFDDALPNIKKTGEEKTYLVEFGKYVETGKYNIEVYLKDSSGNIVSKRTSLSPIPTPMLKLEPISSITFEKSVNYGLLLHTVTIKVKNEGNTQNDTIVTEEIPTFMKAFIYPSGQSISEIVDGKIYYHWFVQGLAPGETRIITYTISLWNIWALIQILIIAVIFAFRFVYVPVIVKGFRHSGPIKREKAIQITLEAKNRSIYEIKDVIVRDFVPPIVKVVDRFDTVKPIVRKIGTGTEIIWRFDSLKSREERVLTYWILPSVDIPGSLKLPKAYIKFIDKKKIRKTSFSKEVIIKSA